MKGNLTRALRLHGPTYCNLATSVLFPFTETIMRARLTLSEHKQLKLAKNKMDTKFLQGFASKHAHTLATKALTVLSNAVYTSVICIFRIIYLFLEIKDHP